MKMYRFKFENYKGFELAFYKDGMVGIPQVPFMGKTFLNVELAKKAINELGY